MVPIAHNVDPIRMNISVFPNVPDLYIALRFNILGFFYFLKAEIAFSLWFFNLVSYGLRSIFGILGVTSSERLGGLHAVWDPILAHHAMGAMLVLFLGGLWIARPHLRAVGRKAFRGAAEVDDGDEILSYRAAVILLVVCSAVIVGWLGLAGMPVWVGAAILCLAAVVVVGYTRAIAEGGLSDASPPVVPAGILVSAVGASVITTQGLVVLATTFLWTTGRSFVMTSCANALRLAEELGPRRRPLFWIMVLALAISLSASIWTILTLSHEHGILNLSMRSDRGAYDYIEKVIRTPPSPQLWSWINTGIGAAVMLGLMVARWLYIWWPLHPLGYAIGPIWIMDHLWFNLFWAWLIKVLVLKYGGVRLYLKTRPFFLGMILGCFVPGGLFLILDHFTGMVGNIIFWG